MVSHAAFFKGTAEEVGYVVFDAHGGKYDGKLFVGSIPQGSLLYNLSRQLVVGESVSREDRELLPADQCGQAVNCGDSGVDIVSRVFPHDRVQREAVYIPL